MDLKKRIEVLEKKVAELEKEGQEQPDIGSIIQDIKEELKIQYAKSFIPENPFGD